jgi:hypothetical protein
LLEVLEVNVEPRDPDFEYGAVVSAHLVVRGPLVPATWWPNDVSYEHRNMRLMFRRQSHGDGYTVDIPNIETPVHGAALSNIDSMKSDLFLSQDAVETGWPDSATSKDEFTVDVHCLFLQKIRMLLDGRWRYRGLLLVAEPIDKNAFRRAGHFRVDLDSGDVLKDVECREVTLY